MANGIRVICPQCGHMGWADEDMEPWDGFGYKLKCCGFVGTMLDIPHEIRSSQTATSGAESVASRWNELEQRDAGE